MNSQSVDLIYLDPPFNSSKNYFAPIGSSAEGAKFEDVWRMSDIKAEWIEDIQAKDKPLWSVIVAAGLVHGEAMKAYLAYMAVRIQEMQRVLKATGSLYLHCDPTASHYLKLVLDCVFGKQSFQSEVVWGYRTQGVSMSHWPRKHDILLHYGKSKTPTFNPQKEKVRYSKPFRHTQKDKDGYYVEVYVRDVWDDDPKAKALISQSKERTGYPTQKPLAVLRRIIAASSNENDIVLDPFCGCATALVAAEMLGRQWIGIDIERKARDLVRERLKQESENHRLWKQAEGQGPPEVVHRTDALSRTDLGKLPHYAKHKDTLYGKSGGHCGGCKDHFQKRNLEVDHVVPRSKGGTDHLDNLQLLCGFCNRTKGSGTQEALLAKLRAKGFELTAA